MCPAKLWHTVSNDSDWEEVVATETALIRDVIVVIPGIMGSELRDREDNPLWAVSPGALAQAIRTFGKSVLRLQLPQGIGDEAPNDGVRPTALINSLHVIPGIWSPITGYDGLLGFLRSWRFHLVEEVSGNPEIIPNFIPFPYDWRLSNRYNAKRLGQVATDALERWRAQPGMEDAKLILICHSMGGLVARWFAEHEKGADLIRAIITIGTPHRGSIKALATLANGLERGVGPFSLNLTSFARSLPSLYQLLPTYDCVVTADGRTPLAKVQPSTLDPSMLADAAAFHAALDEAPSYKLHKVVGIRQPTVTTASLLIDGTVEVHEDIDGENNGGDSTVPRLAAVPFGARTTDIVEVAAQHGELQSMRALLDLADGILTREEIIWQGSPADAFGVRMAETWSAGMALHLQVTELHDRRLWVKVQNETGTVVQDRIRVMPDGTASLSPLAEGGYRATVYSEQPGGPSPISKPFLVLDPTAGQW